jgi:hypothetical protein
VFEAQSRIPPSTVALQAYHPAQAHDRQQRPINGHKGPALFDVAAMEKGRQVSFDQPFLGGRPIGYPVVAKDFYQVAQGVALAAFLPVDPGDRAVVADDGVTQAGIPLDETLPRFLQGEDQLPLGLKRRCQSHGLADDGRRVEQEAMAVAVGDQAFETGSMGRGLAFEDGAQGGVKGRLAVFFAGLVEDLGQSAPAQILLDQPGSVEGHEPGHRSPRFVQGAKDRGFAPRQLAAAALRRDDGPVAQANAHRTLLAPLARGDQRRIGPGMPDPHQAATGLGGGEYEIGHLSALPSHPNGSTACAPGWRLRRRRGR